MPPILAGILSIYGLVVSVVISSSLKEKSALHTNFMYLSGGLACGLCCLASGLCIGIVGDAGVRGAAQQPRMFMGMMLMLIFAEVLGRFRLVLMCGGDLLTPVRYLWAHRCFVDDSRCEYRSYDMLVKDLDKAYIWKTERLVVFWGYQSRCHRSWVSASMQPLRSSY